LSSENNKSQALSPLDGGSSFSLKNRIIRFIWTIVWCLFAAWTPPSLHRWRRFLLCLFGAKMGYRSDVRGSSRVWLPSHLIMADHALIGSNVNCYNQAMIQLGERALISQGAHLCAGSHDIDDPQFTLIAKPIYIGDFVWVAADAFVGPGCIIEEGAVVGARGVAFGRLNAWTVYAGNPVKALRQRKLKRQNNSLVTDEKNV
jgi:putative colanic acid biosynthesis acetyltransferase WcaF